MDRLTAFFTHNWRAKLSSIVLAIIIWVMVGSGTQRAGVFPGDVPVKVVNRGVGLTATLDTRAVKVTILAERVIWQRLSPNMFQATIDLNGATTGVVERNVLVTSRVPGVQITKVEPETVLVRLEPLVTKDLKVDVKLSGETATGFIPTEITTDPEIVTVSGGQNQLDQLELVSASVILDGEKESIERIVTLQPTAGEKIVDGVTISPSEARVKVSIKPTTNNKNVGIILDTDGVIASGLAISSIQISPAAAVVSGPLDVLTNLQNLRTIKVDLGTLIGSQTVKTTLILPESVNLVSPSTKEIQINFTIEEVEIKQEFDAVVEPKNIKKDFIATVKPSSAKIVIEAKKSVMDTVKDLKITPDAIGFTKAGKYTLDLQSEDIILPQGASLVSINPNQVELELVQRPQ